MDTKLHLVLYPPPPAPGPTEENEGYKSCAYMDVYGTHRVCYGYNLEINGATITKMGYNYYNVIS